MQARRCIGQMTQFNLKALFVLTALAASWCCWFTSRIRREEAAGRFFETKRASVVAAPRAVCGIQLGARVTNVEICDRLRRQNGGPASRLVASRNVVVSRSGRPETDDGSGEGAFDDADVRRLWAFPELIDLTIESHAMTDRCLEDVGVLTQLKSLTVRAPRVTDRGIEHLKDLAHLESLELSSDKITDRGVARLLPSLPRLRSLRIHGRVGRRTIRAIASMRYLEALNVCSPEPGRLAASDILSLHGLPSLKSISIDGDIEDVVGVTRALQRDNPLASVRVVDSLAFSRRIRNGISR